MDQTDLSVTFWLEPRAGAPLVDRATAARDGELPIAERSYPERAPFLRESDAEPEAFAAIERLAERAGVSSVERKWRRVVLRGTRGACSAAAKEMHGSRAAAAIRAVIGFSEVARIRSYARIVPSHAANSGTDLGTFARCYDFPSEFDGTGSTIAIISFGGVFHRYDFERALGPLARADHVSFAPRDGLAHAPKAAEADAELALDTQIAALAAPGAALVISDAPNDVRGYVEAVASALLESHRIPTVLSISYGLSETLFTKAALRELESLFALAAHLGTTVVAASGDSGAHAPQQEIPPVSYPASSPLVLACGGTALRANAVRGRRFRESVWNEGEHATGGGHSHAFPGRRVPDVAAHAATKGGYRICMGDAVSIGGGTSAAAPLWAGLLARCAQGAGKPLGFVTPLLYAAPKAFFDVRHGHNGRYHAQRGADACTGLGAPRGGALLRVLATTPR